MRRLQKPQKLTWLITICIHGLGGKNPEDEARRIASNIAWYLDDLVLTPVNHLTSSERKAKWLTAQNSLADRIAEYQPLAIVSLLLGIQRIVEAAAIAAGHPGDDKLIMELMESDLEALRQSGDG